jgi:hypothetical protein
MKKFPVAVVFLLFSLVSSAQLAGLKDRLIKKGLPTVDQLLQGKPPITTSLSDAEYASDVPNASLAANEPVRGLLELQRTPNGGFVLQPGLYEFHGQSYCLKAGTHGPGGGDGYLYAPTAGPEEDAVTTIVRNSVNHPDLQQHMIQQLLWAIIARAKFEDLRTDLKAVAARLLRPQQIAKLNRNAVDFLPASLVEKAKESVPPVVQQVIEAENNLRRMLTDPTASFAEMERVAVLAGAVGMGPGSRDVPSGRWSLHPDGYYVRYLPKGYSYTVVQVWVPNGSPAVGKEYDPSTHIAVPGNTSRQRLIQSGRPKQQ